MYDRALPLRIVWGNCEPGSRGTGMCGHEDKAQPWASGTHSGGPGRTNLTTYVLYYDFEAAAEP